MLRLAFDFIITWRETRTRPNAYQIAIVRYIGGKIRRFIMMQPKDYSSFGCIIYMFNLRAFYSTPKSL